VPDGQVTFRWRDSAHHNDRSSPLCTHDKFFALPAASASARLRAYPHFGSWPADGAPRHCPMLPLVGCGARSAYRRTHFLHRRRSRLYRCPKCGGPMKVIERLTAAEIQLRSPPQSALPHETALYNSTLRALPRATLLSASSAKQIFFLPPLQQQFSQHRFTVAIFWVACDGSCSAAQLRRTSKPSLPTS